MNVVSLSGLLTDDLPSFSAQPEFLKTLSEVLKVGSNSVVARMQAGLQLKNQLTSKDPNVKLQFQQRWLQIPEDVKAVVKMNVSTILDLHFSGFTYLFPWLLSLLILHHCLVPSFCSMFF